MGRKLDEQALTLAVAAAVRHNHTEYDELLANGVDRAAARHRVVDKVEEIGAVAEVSSSHSSFRRPCLRLMT